MADLTDKIYYLLTDEKCPVDFFRNNDAFDCAKMITEYVMPAVNVEPVIHAEWRFDSGCGEAKHYRCSRCGRLVFSMGIVPILEKFPYCHCGAKMGGPEDGTD